MRQSLLVERVDELFSTATGGGTLPPIVVGVSIEDDRVEGDGFEARAELGAAWIDGWRRTRPLGLTARRREDDGGARELQGEAADAGESEQHQGGTGTGWENVCGGSMARSSAIVSPSVGWCNVGASSQRGSRTKARS